ncbi:MAG: type II toxin-antitoxin system VapC family toxin [Gammaproteobacteria bacterium]
MVIDTSALLAILQDEPERRLFNEAIEAAESRVISAASFVETSIVIESRYGAEGQRDLDLFLGRAEIELVAVDSEQAHVARGAFSHFGKGRHKAGLNYGDCFSYALAKVRGEPLLYKGDDFSQTDVTPFVPALTS